MRPPGSRRVFVGDERQPDRTNGRLATGPGGAVGTPGVARRRSCFRLGPALVVLGLAVALSPQVWPGGEGPVAVVVEAALEVVAERARAVGWAPR